MELQSLIWLLPVLFALHDGEEILTWSWWMRRKGTHIFSFGSKSGNWVSQDSRQMTVAVVVVGIALLAGTVQGARALSTGVRPYLFAAVLAIWLLHAAVHLGSTLRHRMYTPGVVSAILICIPHGLLTYQRLLATGSLSWPEALVSGLVGLALAPALLWLAHRTGRLLVHG